MLQSEVPLLLLWRCQRSLCLSLFRVMVARFDIIAKLIRLTLLDGSFHRWGTIGSLLVMSEAAGWNRPFLPHYFDLSHKLLLNLINFLEIILVPLQLVLQVKNLEIPVEKVVVVDDDRRIASWTYLYILQVLLFGLGRINAAAAEVPLRSPPADYFSIRQLFVSWFVLVALAIVEWRLQAAKTGALVKLLLTVNHLSQLELHFFFQLLLACAKGVFMLLIFLEIYLARHVLVLLRNSGVFVRIIVDWFDRGVLVIQEAIYAVSARLVLEKTICRWKMGLQDEIRAKTLDVISRRLLKRIEEVVVSIINRRHVMVRILEFINRTKRSPIVLLYVKWVQFLLTTFLFAQVSPDFQILVVLAALSSRVDRGDRFLSGCSVSWLFGTKLIVASVRRSDRLLVDDLLRFADRVISIDIWKIKLFHWLDRLALKLRWLFIFVLHIELLMLLQCFVHRVLALKSLMDFLIVCNTFVNDAQTRFDASSWIFLVFIWNPLCYRVWRRRVLLRISNQAFSRRAPLLRMDFVNVVFVSFIFIIFLVSHAIVLPFVATVTFDILHRILIFSCALPASFFRIVKVNQILLRLFLVPFIGSALRCCGLRLNLILIDVRNVANMFTLSYAIGVALGLREDVDSLLFYLSASLICSNVQRTLSSAGSTIRSFFISTIVDHILARWPNIHVFEVRHRRVTFWWCELEFFLVR